MLVLFTQIPSSSLVIQVARGTHVPARIQILIAILVPLVGGLSTCEVCMGVFIMKKTIEGGEGVTRSGLRSGGGGGEMSEGRSGERCRIFVCIVGSVV